MKNNRNSIYTTIGASAHSKNEREANDYYATPKHATEALLKYVKFSQEIYEPACGEGHISKVLVENNYNVTSSDIIDRGYGDFFEDFLSVDTKFNGDIITNPPYKHALEFLQKSLSILNECSKVAFLLRIQFLEGKKRKLFFDKNPIKLVLVFSERIICEMNGNFSKSQGRGGATCFAWFIFEKGFKGDTIIKHI